MQAVVEARESVRFAGGSQQEIYACVQRVLVRGNRRDRAGSRGGATAPRPINWASEFSHAPTIRSDLRVLLPSRPHL